MTRYLLRRLGAAAVVLVIVTAAVSLVTRLIPGNVVTTQYGAHASKALIHEANHQMGLDTSVPGQVVHYIGDVVQGNFGTDFVTGHSVASLIGQSLPYTLVLVLVGLGLAVLIGVPLGVFAAGRPGSMVDKLTGGVSVGLISLPYYVTGLLLILVFGVSLRIFPIIGAGSESDPASYISHLVLPAVALAAAWVGYLARLVRANMLEVLGTNHVRMMTGFGVTRGRVFYKYALRVAAAPTISVLGVGFGTLLGGTIFIEVIFDRPGVGTLLYNAIEARDYSVLQGTVLVIAVLLIAGNLLADLAYTSLDRRIELGGHGAS